MLNNFDDRTLKAAHWLKTRAQHEFEIMMEFLEAELIRIDEQNRVVKDDTNMRWNQGACQLLEDFIHQVKTSGEVIDIINERKKT